MATFLVVPHPGRPKALESARSTMQWLSDNGHDVRVSEDTAQSCDLGEWSTNADELSTNVDLALSFGGDGTMLRAVKVALDADVPVMGVNFGGLGYLTQVEPSEVRLALGRFLQGDFEIEQRMTLDVCVQYVDDNRVQNYTGLNEAVLEKTVSGHVTQLAVSIDDKPFLTYAADGVIIATPTGSTAYNLSARGPIVSPRIRALLLTPVSPHMLFDRALIFEPEQSLRFEVLGNRAASLVIDGTASGLVDPGDVVVCTAGKQSARFVTFGKRDFHHILKQKFELADR